jgi:6-phosphogluconate dehydrogenase (decarboxylating)
MLQAYAEGFESEGLLLQGPHQLATLNRGSVALWLLELAKRLRQDPELSSPGPQDDSGEGRWTLEPSTRTPAPAIAASLFAASPAAQDSFAMRSQLRNEFGHGVKTP